MYTTVFTFHKLYSKSKNTVEIKFYYWFLIDEKNTPLKRTKLSHAKYISNTE